MTGVRVWAGSSQATRRTVGRELRPRKHTPAAVIDLADPKIRLADLGGTVLPGTPAEFGKLIADETNKWANVIRFAGIKPE